MGREGDRGRAPHSGALRTRHRSAPVPVGGQYSSAKRTVRTRVVTASSAGLGEPNLRARS